MKIEQIISVLENWASPADAEDFDNVGLQIGDASQEISKALVTLDVTDAVLEEAIKENAGLVITFHPLIFKGFKRLTGATREERLSLKAIKNNIAIYAIHTNLDAQLDGVNGMICDRLGLINNQILIPKTKNLYKLIFYVPIEHTEEVCQAIYAAGGGEIGNYSDCSFRSQGTGTFTPSEKANPTLGERGKPHSEAENRVEILIQKKDLPQCLEAMRRSHPYEEVAYEAVLLENLNPYKGMGQIGDFPDAMEESAFLEYIKHQMNTDCVRHSGMTGKPIKRVAVLGGSGAFAISAAQAQRADAYLTADLKYHDFFLADGKILLCDVGHYESEQFTKNLITTYLSEKFSNFAFLTSKINTNSINYHL